MKKLKKFFCLASALLALSCIFLAACGSPKEPSPSDEPPSPPPAEGVMRTVTLVYNNGEENGEVKAEEGKPAAQPDDPVFGPHTFLGWYRAGALYDWSTPVTEDIAVQALWEKQYSGALEVRSGSWAYIGDMLSSGLTNNLITNETDGFDRGTIEVTVRSDVRSDSGIALCVTGNGTSSYWEADVSYYFFFLNIDGNAYLGKIDRGIWTGLKVLPIPDYRLGNSYRLKTVLDGTDIYCYVDGKLYIAFSERNFLQGTGYGLRAGAPNVVFSDLKVSGKCLYSDPAAS